MEEEYLHYIFKKKLLGDTFVTSQNKNVTILNFGKHNSNSGPDFLEGSIKIEDEIWAGQIEFHVKSSDWIKHKHHLDSNYNNVILHFVYQHDLEIKSGEYTLPTIELKPLIDKVHYQNYKNYITSKNWVACQNDIQSIDEFIIFQQKEKALFHRLTRKSSLVKTILKTNQGDRTKTFYTLHFKSFGTKVNQTGFEKLGELFNWKNLAKLNFDKFKIEAYLFGLSGFLNDDFEDEYFMALKTEYSYLKELFELEEMSKSHWKFSAMRPYNLPTIRIAQLSNLLAKNNLLNQNSSLKEIKETLNSGISEYWKMHYMFGRKGKHINPGLTKSFIDLLLINVYVPFNFTIGLLEDNETLKTKSFEWLESIKPEQNSITKKWRALGVNNNAAFDSQALIELKNEFCNKNQCLHCKIGQNILKG